MAWKKFLNYFGQLRIYSIIDLILLLIAINTGIKEFFGVLFLHLGFLLYLEFKHRHSYRKSFPSWLWVVLSIIGAILYFRIAIFGFIISSFLYVEKQKKYIGAMAPLFRGLQCYSLIGGLLGFMNHIALISFALLFLRNTAGDFRDILKDKKEKMITLPILLGFRKDVENMHLIFLLITSFVWWYMADISLLWLILAYIIQILSYNITPR